MNPTRTLAEMAGLPETMPLLEVIDVVEFDLTEDYDRPEYNEAIHGILIEMAKARGWVERFEMLLWQECDKLPECEL